MGMREIMQNAALTAFKAAGNLIVLATYVSITDDGLSASNTVIFTLQLLPGEFSIRERNDNENIQAGDIIGMVLTNELSIEPKEGDEVTFGLKNYRVVTYSTDAAGATKKLHLRKA